MLAAERRLLGPIGVAIGLFVLVGASADNAARPALGPSGWAPGSWLPITLTPAAVTGCLWGAYVIGAAGTYAALRASTTPGVQRLRALPWWLLGVLGVLVLLTQPFGSADHVNYAAYGRIFVGGGDPYTQAPIDWAGGHDPVTSAVEAPWTTAPSVYGPLATLLQGLAAGIGGANLREIVWVWQVVLVLAWLATRWLLRRLTADHTRVDVLWTLNPLVLGLGLFGAHVDVIAVPFAVSAIALAGRSPALAGVFGGLAAATKATYALVLLALGLSWWLGSRRGASRRLISAGAAALATLVLVHLPFNVHVYDQVWTVRRYVSLATPWRPLLDTMTGPLAGSTVRTMISVGAVIIALALAYALWRITAGLAPDTPEGTAARMTLVLTTAYTLAAPYSLPWYDVLTWAVLASLAASRLDLVLLARGVVMAAAYVPGRVLGMTPRVAQLTLGIRRYVAPYAAFAAWVAIGWVSVRARSIRRDPAP
ncbi:MAG: hypothetical protein ACK5MP_06655 [Nostocoides sp.]